MARAVLAGDLLRFALRLWLQGIPAALVCTDQPDTVPQPIRSLLFLECLFHFFSVVL